MKIQWTQSLLCVLALRASIRMLEADMAFPFAVMDASSTVVSIDAVLDSVDALAADLFLESTV